MKILKLRTMYHTNMLVLVSATFQLRAELASKLELAPKLFIFPKHNDRFMAAIHRDTAGIEIANLNGGKSWYLDLEQRKIDYNYEYYDKHQMALFKTIRDYAVKRKDMSKLLSALSL